MGSTGTINTGANNKNIIVDNYGRNIELVDNVPGGYELWLSGTFRGSNENYYTGYAVFAKIKDNSVDATSLKGIKITGEEATTINNMPLLGNTTSASIKSYINKYDKDKSSSYVKRRVERYKKALPIIEKLGI